MSTPVLNDAQYRVRRERGDALSVQPTISKASVTLSPIVRTNAVNVNAVASEVLSFDEREAEASMRILSLTALQNAWDDDDDAPGAPDV